MGVIIMTNNEKLKQAIEQDLNSKNYYNKIMNQIERQEKMKKKRNMWKWSLVPVCLVVVISGILFFSNQNNKKTILKNNPYIDKNNNVELNINEINNYKDGIIDADLKRIDANIEEITNNNENFPLPYKNGIVNLPKDLNKTYKYILYFRENRESKEYNILGNYEIVYSNDKDRSIQVKYSKEHKPVRDYYFDDDGSKITMINGIELKIYKFENIYFTEFNYNDYTFDIETSKITEQELSDLLISILK